MFGLCINIYRQCFVEDESQQFYRVRNTNVLKLCHRLNIRLQKTPTDVILWLRSSV